MTTRPTDEPELALSMHVRTTNITDRTIRADVAIDLPGRAAPDPTEWPTVSVSVGAHRSTYSDVPSSGSDAPFERPVVNLQAIYTPLNRENWCRVRDGIDACFERYFREFGQ